MKACIKWLKIIRFKLIGLVVTSCRSTTEDMFSSKQHLPQTNVLKQQVAKVYDSNIAPFVFHIPNVKYLCCLFSLLQTFYMGRTC
jgi:uncharacterized membrane protein